MHVQVLEQILAKGGGDLRAGLEDGRIRVGGSTGLRPGAGPTQAQDARAAAWGAWPTGVEAIDRTLPGGGLRAGATHEWFGSTLDPQGEGQARRGGEWVPPLGVILEIAKSGPGRHTPGKEEGLVLFIGRRCWPMPGAIGALRDRALFLDPDCDAARFWSIDQALRCAGVSAVIADATRLDMAGSRRLQLAAEAGGATAFLLRPPWERPVISASETRWAVMPEAPPIAGERRPRWRLELLRCKGAPLASQASGGGGWVVELVQEVGRETVRVPADVVGGSGEKAGVETGAGGRAIA